MPRGADAAELKRAYRTAALALHPDVCTAPDAAARFAAVVRAYEEATSAGGGGGERGRAGLRTVGGVLLMSLAEVRRDQRYRLYAVRLAVDRQLEGAGAGAGAAESAAVAPPAAEPDDWEEHVDAASGKPYYHSAARGVTRWDRPAGFAGGAGEGGSGALATDVVHEVHVSGWDSIGDVRLLLQDALGLPESLRHPRRARRGGHELIFRGQLLGEHLFVRDYDLRDGDTVHFACRVQP